MGSRRSAARGWLVAAVGAAVLVGTALAPAPAGLAAVETRTGGTAVTTPRMVLDVPYAAGDPAHRLDLYLPEEDGPHPLVIFVHGGSWRAGTRAVLRTDTPQDDQALLAMLLGRGYAVASVSYRFSQVARYPAQLHDVKAATRYLRATARYHRLDPDRFAVVGQSAGGHLAQLLGVTRDSGDRRIEGDLGITAVSSHVSAVVSFYGVSDLASVVPDRVAAGCARGEDGVRGSAGRLLGGDPQAHTMRARARAASPISHVGLTSPPMLLLHGNRDCLVPANQSRRMAEALRSLGVEARVIEVDAGHGGPAFHTTPRVREATLDFLDRALAPRPRPGALDDPRQTVD